MVESSDIKQDDAKAPGNDVVTACPMCGAKVPEGAAECPNCEEPFTPEAFEATLEKEEKGSKWMFWTGLILVIIGGPGVALGSWLHDLLNISIANYDNFDSFGWANRLVASVGMIILVVGIIMLILSLPKLSKDSTGDEDSVKNRKKKKATGDQGG